MLSLLRRFDIERHFLRPWLWAAPIILVYAFLTTRQLNMHPPSTDEFYSLFNAGWLLERSYGWGDVLESLAQYSANHTPGYFLLLNSWGHLVGHDVAMARALSIFCGLLSLAMMYRLTRDFVAPAAGLFGLAILGCSAFYNYYYIYARMYTLLVLLSALTLWLYLRLVSGRRERPLKDYALLCASACALANTHLFSALFFVMLGVCHVVAVRKNRPWLKVSLALVAAGLLFSPWLLNNFAGGVERSLRYIETGAAELPELALIWHQVSFNGTWLLPLLAVTGVALGWRRRLIRRNPGHFMFLFFVLAAALTAAATDAFQLSSMRLLLGGLPALVLFLAAGFYALYRYRAWLILLIALWLLSAFALYRVGTWDIYLGGRAMSLRMPPWQGISRLALEAGYEGALLSFGFTPLQLKWATNINYTQDFHYFERHGMRLSDSLDFATFRADLDVIAQGQSEVWLFYQHSLEVSPEEARQLEAIMDEFGYRACNQAKLGRYTILTEYIWRSMDCRNGG